MKLDAFTVLLGGGAAVTLWYLLRESPRPNYAEPGQQVFPPAPLPPSLEGLPPPPLGGLTWQAPATSYDPFNANAPAGYVPPPASAVSSPAPAQPPAYVPPAYVPPAYAPPAPPAPAPTSYRRPSLAVQQAAIDAAAMQAQQANTAQQTSAPPQMQQSNPPAPPPAGVPISGFGDPLASGRTSGRFRYT